MATEQKPNDERIVQLNETIESIVSKEKTAMQLAISTFDTYCEIFPEENKRYALTKDKVTIEFAKVNTYYVTTFFEKVNKTWKAHFSTMGDYQPKANEFVGNPTITALLPMYISLVADAGEDMKIKVNERLQTYTLLANTIIGTKPS